MLKIFKIIFITMTLPFTVLSLEEISLAKKEDLQKCILNGEINAIIEYFNNAKNMKKRRAFSYVAKMAGYPFLAEKLSKTKHWKPKIIGQLRAESFQVNEVKKKLFNGIQDGNLRHIEEGLNKAFENKINPEAKNGESAFPSGVAKRNGLELLAKYLKENGEAFLRGQRIPLDKVRHSEIENEIRHMHAIRILYAMEDGILDNVNDFTFSWDVFDLLRREMFLDEVVDVKFRDLLSDEVVDEKFRDLLLDEVMGEKFFWVDMDDRLSPNYVDKKTTVGETSNIANVDKNCFLFTVIKSIELNKTLLLLFEHSAKWDKEIWRAINKKLLVEKIHASWTPPPKIYFRERKNVSTNSECELYAPDEYELFSAIRNYDVDTLNKWITGDYDFDLRSEYKGRTAAQWASRIGLKVLGAALEDETIWSFFDLRRLVESSMFVEFNFSVFKGAPIKPPVKRSPSHLRAACLVEI